MTTLSKSALNTNKELKLKLTHISVLEITPTLAANTSEILFLSYLFQEITGLVRLTYSPSRKSVYWGVYYFYSSVSLSMDHLRKKRLQGKFCLVCRTHSSCIYLQWPSSLFRHRVSLKIQLSQKANSKAERENRLSVLSLQQSWMNSLKYLTH